MCFPRSPVFGIMHSVLDCRVHKFKEYALGNAKITFIFFSKLKTVKIKAIDIGILTDFSPHCTAKISCQHKNWGLPGFYKARRRSRGIRLHGGPQLEVQQMFITYRNTFVIYWASCSCFCHHFFFCSVFCMPTSLYIRHWGFIKPHESWHFGFRMTLNWSDCDFLCSISAVCYYEMNHTLYCTNHFLKIPSWCPPTLQEWKVHYEATQGQ